MDERLGKSQGIFSRRVSCTHPYPHPSPSPEALSDGSSWGKGGGGWMSWPQVLGVRAMRLSSRI